ncbi:MAG: P-loop-containing protein [Candidatus Paceibacterota bacterium]
MNNIIIAIGQSGSGKTTWVKQNFVDAHTIENLKEGLVKYCKTDSDCLLLGHYNVGIRTEGTDTLSYNAIDEVLEFMFNEDKCNYSTVVAEGDRINNAKFFQRIAQQSMNIHVELHYFKCDLAESMERLKKAGSTITETFVKTTMTKSANNAKLARQLGFNVTIHDTNSKQRGLWGM